MTAGAAVTPQSGGRCASGFLVGLAALFLALVGGLGAATTTAAAASFTYDAPVTVRVGVHWIETAEALPTRSSDGKDPGSPAVEGRDASTTPLARRVATNTRLDASTLKMTKTVEQHLTTTPRTDDSRVRMGGRY